MDDLEQLFQKALEARRKAYAPYSGFKVGAALQMEGSGEIITGCNVENASYGATVCAERNALFTAIARYGEIRVARILVVTDADPPAVPCALCLQVIQEFCAPTTPIHLAHLQGIARTLTLGELLPHPFSTFS
ncbi:cytidine deaminase [Alkalispirochaeta sphaeroplastigenens]|uniref:Cytidine deaminase n=1 Tax=Alkalispirochaeta sphaeroplastigenens TaxID=1187066 RepID=A0A2S4K107_9SPIO|nr:MULTISPECIES: cytidine deaminase [Alkalispirochaeta]POR05439.1 cytidine deaminase [Alkalispirochaeta sphaeroplastigenens]